MTSSSSRWIPNRWLGSRRTSTSAGWSPTPARSRRSRPPGMAEVDVMVAATGDDEDNLVISLLSKQEFAVPRVIARVNNASNQWLFTESWGVDVPVSTPQLYTALVEEAVSIGSLVHLMSFEGASAHLLEVTLAGRVASMWRVHRRARPSKRIGDRCDRASRAHDHPGPGNAALRRGRGHRARHGRQRARDPGDPRRRRRAERAGSHALDNRLVGATRTIL